MFWVSQLSWLETVFSKSLFRNNRSGCLLVVSRPGSSPGVFLTKTFSHFVIPEFWKDGFCCGLKACRAWARGLCAVYYVVPLNFFGNLNLIPPKQIKMHYLEWFCQRKPEQHRDVQRCPEAVLAPSFPNLQSAQLSALPAPNTRQSRHIMG